MEEEEEQQPMTEEELQQLLVDRVSSARKLLEDAGIPYQYDTDGFMVSIDTDPEIVRQLRGMGFLVVELYFGPAVTRR